MSEDEANNTRCCGPEGCGKAGGNWNNRYCIGSACMAWRSADDYKRARPEKRTGYCGLAGKP